MQIRIPVSVGELLDKIAILEIKQERIEDPVKRRNVERELQLLTAAWEEAHPDPAPQVEELRQDLKKVNEELWEIEDSVRDHEREGRFDDRFVELARSVYLTNDRRASLKKELNLLLGSDLVEEKSYADYEGAG